MLKRVCDVLEGFPATLLGGVMLLLSFLLSRAGIRVPADPAWITVAVSGLPLLYTAVRQLLCGPGISRISSSLLITIAMFAAIAIGDLFAAGEVAFIMAIGELLEDATTNRAKRGLEKLLRLAPTQGRRIRDGKTEMIPAGQIQKDDLLRVFPGETIPVDGVIVSGETSVDQSVMTGESLPVDKAAGDAVFGGTINRFGSIDLRATKVGADSSLQKLIRMVQEAENKKAPTARIADRAASWLVPVSLLIAVLTWAVTRDAVRAVTVLVVFCPCALVLATPTAIMAAIGQAASRGVIIKSGEALEKMGKADTIAFDKTGTLTCGKPEVCDILPLVPSLDENRLLYLAASAEDRSEHPLGKAIAAAARSRGITPGESSAFRMSAGKGIYAEVDGAKLRCGSEKYLRDHGVGLSEQARAAAEKLRQQGKAAILTAMDGRCIGVLALADVLRPAAAAMTEQLAAMQTKTVLLTGDNTKTAAYFAEQAGIREVYAELLPEDKVEKISVLQRQGRNVCMIGDGVNDAPALKTAAVGVAMGSMGSDIAVEAADIALMSDDLSKIPYLKRLSDATVKTIRFSITLSMCINLLAVTLSVLGLLTPTSGALVHNIGSCFVVLIAALLYDRKFE